jgi:hypothetical protein
LLSSSFNIRRSISLIVTNELQKRGRLPWDHEDDTLITLVMEDIEFINVRHARKYITEMHAEAEHINQPTLGFVQGHFKITILFCMYVLGYTFLL